MDQHAAARRLNAERRHGESLRVVEQLIEQVGLSAELDLIRGQALAGLEQFRAAYDVARNLLESGGEAVAPMAKGLQAHVLRRSSRYIDDALELALEAAVAAERRGEAYRAVAGRARVDAARVFSRKRCRGLAERELALAAEALGGAPRVDYHRGFVALDFDDRPVAREIFAALAAHEDGRYYGTLGLAYVEFVMGEFDGAHAHLDSLGELPGGALWPRRLRSRIFAAEQKWEECQEALDALIEASPGADARWRDELERAACLYRQDRVQDAAAAYAGIADGAPEGNWYRTQAQRMANLLGHPESTHRARRRLKEFPSVTQLRDHCGPASCELYLRFFGLSADQIEIAREIKSPHGGTPVYKMRRCLESAGFETRRIEAPLPRIKALIDAGVPVIVEEAYSSSNHVAVAIGYDDARELLEVQDPMTHQVRETHYEDLAEIRNLSNHGALVGVPAGDAKMLAALDAAGAVECAYIARTDEAWAAYDAEDFERADALADEAIGLHREYELAWLYRFRRARERAQAEESGAAAGAKVALHAVVNEVVAIWPDDEWPQQLLGQVLYFEGRTDEALVAFERARDRDDPDPYNWSMIADCHLRWGEHDKAYEALVEAVARDPGYVRANENLADMAMRRGRRTLARALNDVALELQPDNYFNHAVRGQLMEKVDPEDALAAYGRALEIDDSRDWVATHRGKLLARIGRVDEAVAAFEELVARREGDVGLRIDFADLLYVHDRSERAVEVCDAMLAQDESIAGAHAIRAGARAKLGALDEAVVGFRAALARRPVYPWVYGEMGKFLREAGRQQEALEALAAALGLSGGAPVWEYELGDALVRFGYEADGVRHLRRAAINGGLSEAQLERIGELIVETKSGGADEFFQQVQKARGADLAVLRAHARTLLQVLWAPRAAEPVLEQIAALDAADPYAMTARGERLMDAGLSSEQEGERLLVSAVTTEPDLVYPRRVFAACLNERGRFEEAVALLADCEPAYTTSRLLVMAHCGVGDLDSAAEAIAAFEGVFGAGVGSMMLQFQVARRQWDWTRALELAEGISREVHERDDDGRLDRWEEERFECLARLGEVERARRFGEAQAVDAASLGRLAYAAYKADQLALARPFADRALRLDPDEPLALAALARCLEVAGDVDACIATWRHLGAVDPEWHIWQEQLARIACAGEVTDETAELAAAAVASGHLCPWSYAVRAQVRLLRGDEPGARADLDRAWQLARPEDREHTAFDIWALRADLTGAPAAQLWTRYLAQDALAATDHARVHRVRPPDTP